MEPILVTAVQTTERMMQDAVNSKQSRNTST